MLLLSRQTCRLVLILGVVLLHSQAYGSQTDAAKSGSHTQGLAADSDLPMAKDSPRGVVMAGRLLQDPKILNASLSSEAMKLWKGQVKQSAKDMMKNLAEEIVSDDPEGRGAGGSTEQEVQDVIQKVRCSNRINRSSMSSHNNGAAEDGGDA